MRRWVLVIVTAALLVAPCVASGAGAATGSRSASGASIAAPPLSSISVGDGSVLEGDSGTRSIKFPVTLSEPATSAVSVQYVVAGVSATGGSKPAPGVDFKTRSGTVTFKLSAKTGVTSIAGSISVTVYPDADPEPNQTLTVTLSNPSPGFGISRGVGTGTIVNDDGIVAGPTLGIGDAAIVKAESGSQKLTFPVTLSTGVANPLTLTYTITAGSATYGKKSTDGGDFGGSKLTGTLTFASQKTARTIAVPIWAEAGPDDDEAFTITLSGLSSSDATLVRGTGTGTIFSTVPVANPGNLPIRHVLVLMQENRSADHYLGQLPGFGAEPLTGNPDPTNPGGPAILPFHETNYCETADLGHSWNQTHHEIDGGAMDGFTAANVTASDPNGHRTMGYYNSTDLPFYYGLYQTFATGDRYFASAPTQTFPNRLYLLAGTSAGHIRNDAVLTNITSVFERLDAAGVSWKIYADDPNGLSYGALFFKYVNDRQAGHVFPTAQYYTDLANNALPDVAYIDPKLTDANPQTDNDEHPRANVQVGQKFVADHINALMNSSSWATSAFFLAYDEHGGFYDHVAPPAAVPPDAIPPNLQAGDVAGAFDTYGPRVPSVVVSPYSKPGFVSHVVQDHTSILKFIETRFGLPALTARDAAADPMLDHFDFSTATFATPPTLPAAVIDPVKLAACPSS